MVSMITAEYQGTQALQDFDPNNVSGGSESSGNVSVIYARNATDTYTGQVYSNQLIRSITIPGRTMKANGSLRITIVFQFLGGGVGNKAIRVRYGDSATGGVSYTNTANILAMKTWQVFNSNSESIQTIVTLNDAALPAISSSGIGGTVNSTLDAPLCIYITLADSSETINISRILVEAIPYI